MSISNFSNYIVIGGNGIVICKAILVSPSTKFCSGIVWFVKFVTLLALRCWTMYSLVPLLVLSLRHFQLGSYFFEKNNSYNNHTVFDIIVYLIIIVENESLFHCCL